MKYLKLLITKIIKRNGINFNKVNEIDNYMSIEDAKKYIDEVLLEFVKIKGQK
jgi:hypothetical protein